MYAKEPVCFPQEPQVETNLATASLKTAARWEDTALSTREAGQSPKEAWKDYNW